MIEFEIKLGALTLGNASRRTPGSPWDASIFVPGKMIIAHFELGEDGSAPSVTYVGNRPFQYPEFDRLLRIAYAILPLVGEEET